MWIFYPQITQKTQIFSVYSVCSVGNNNPQMTQKSVYSVLSVDKSLKDKHIEIKKAAPENGAAFFYFNPNRSLVPEDC